MERQCRPPGAFAYINAYIKEPLYTDPLPSARSDPSFVPSAR
jgi:hypothetical protein